MKISIIIPVYNCEQYLEQCLDSVCNQTIDELEIIAVDDGSTDSSYDILKRYRDEYPKTLQIFTQPNAGQASARNLALNYASGDFLGFVDSDDWVDKTMYETMYKKAIDNNADIVVCDMVDDYGTYNIYHNSSQFTNKFKVTPSACNKLFKRSLVKNLDFPVGRWYEDFNYTTKALLLTNKIECINSGFYHCHCSNVSTMRNNNSLKNLDMLVVIDNLIAFAKTNNCYEKHVKDFDYIIIEHVLITTINRVYEQTSKDRKAVLQQLRDYSKIHIGNLKSNPAYLDLPENRRFIASLNYMGLYSISKMIFTLKKLIKRK